MGNINTKDITINKEEGTAMIVHDIKKEYTSEEVGDTEITMMRDGGKHLINVMSIC